MYNDNRKRNAASWRERTRYGRNVFLPRRNANSPRPLGLPPQENLIRRYSALPPQNRSPNVSSKGDAASPASDSKEHDTRKRRRKQPARAGSCGQVAFHDFRTAISADFLLFGRFSTRNIRLVHPVGNFFAHPSGCRAVGIASDILRLLMFSAMSFEVTNVTGDILPYRTIATRCRAGRSSSRFIDASREDTSFHDMAVRIEAWAAPCAGARYQQSHALTSDDAACQNYSRPAGSATPHSNRGVALAKRAEAD